MKLKILTTSSNNIVVISQVLYSTNDPVYNSIYKTTNGQVTCRVQVSDQD